jgi:hypothetical protein
MKLRHVFSYRATISLVLSPQCVLRFLLSFLFFVVEAFNARLRVLIKKRQA